MSANGRFRAVLIGGDTLLVACGDLLLARGDAIVCVLSRAVAVKEWCARNSIPVLEPTRASATELARHEFDHLFSIAHLAVVPDEILRLAKGERINFHDGPLPDVAGLNTPNWAIATGAGEHGVTWHRMTSGVDEGEILIADRFTIEPDETALSLNTKCFEAGLRTFGAIVEQVSNGTLSPRPQDLSRRRYYSRGDRPPASGVIDWSRDAGELWAWVRAVDAGRYKNPFGVLKTSCAGTRWIVKRAHVGSVASSSPPGTMLPTEAGALAVATGAGALCLDEVTDLCGRPIPLADVRSHVAAHGGAFDAPSGETADRLTRWSTDLGKAEEFWTERLLRAEPVELPFLGTPTVQAGETRSVELQSLQALISSAPAVAPRAVVLAALTAWIARTSGRAAFDVAYSHATLRERLGALEGWISPRVPVHVEWDAALDFAAHAARTARELAAIDKRGSFLHDLVSRDPELSAHASLAQGFELPVVVEHVRSHESAPPGTRAARFLVTDGGACRLEYDPALLAPESLAALQDSLAAFVDACTSQPTRALAAQPIVGPRERDRLTRGFDATDRVPPAVRSIHAAIADQARRTPDAPAVSSGAETITYAELDRRSNRLAAHLRTLGVARGDYVGVCIDRSVDLVVGVVAVLKTGAAYLPLDPAFPEERTRFMLADSGARVALAKGETRDRVSAGARHVVLLDGERAHIDALPADAIESGTAPGDLAYVIYTSGSTGQPKGVMVEHGNVLNFFVGMDERVPHDPPGTWLAVTSLSFDISVLELVWTLARGFHVVVNRSNVASSSGGTAQRMDFSLFYFSSDASAPGREKYRLLLEGARFADEHGFVAVWTPERHFHTFGGVYPAPAVAGAAVASITKYVGIRSGSVVLPLHHPIRVVESWSVVDNISDGRVGISFASGWQPNDFVLAPENYSRAKQVMFESLESVRKLWRGEAVTFPGPKGDPVTVKTLPRPVQQELPVWITTAGNPETYVQAGRSGAHLLTHLLGQSIDELAPKIELYKRARAEAGHDPETGVVSLMLHTFVAEADTDVRAIVRGPLRDYLGTSLDLLKKYAWAFPAFKKPASANASSGDEFAGLTEEERDAVLEHAFERYFETSGLFGTPEQCVEIVEKLRSIGVSEIACLIDFGVPVDTALSALPALDRLRRLTTLPAQAAHCPLALKEPSIAEEIRVRRVTHMQCTPSMARMLCLDHDARGALWTIPSLFVGGEAFPPALATDLANFPGRITNMYGPTETTIWSSTHAVEKGSTSIPIGTAIANTRFYVLDANQELLPVGVPGELWIAGDGVARGYHGRDDLTRERFRPDPFRADGGSRMYRTGDLGRRRADGMLEFLGRLDHQVKIRGYRIELGEIETQLAAHPAVSEAVVVAGIDAHGEARLVAYLIPKSRTIVVDEVREALRGKLPEYMVPGWFVVLDRFPLTPNGKVDRKALPAPETKQDAAKRAEFVAPSSGLEAELAALWQEVLGLERVGVDDNFFDVGGHSLLVVRMHRRVVGMVEKPVSLTDLYRFPTIRSFSEWASSDGTNKTVEGGAERGARRREALLRRRRD